MRAVLGPAWDDSAYYAGHAAVSVPHPITHYVLFLAPHCRRSRCPRHYPRSTRAITE